MARKGHYLMSDISKKIKVFGLKQLSGIEKDQCGAWDVVLQFNLLYDEDFLKVVAVSSGDDYDDEEPAENILGEWLSYNFSKGFVLIGIGSKTLAGGSTDNKKAWDDGWPRNKEFYPDYYQIRCSHQDATLFYLKFGSK